MQLLEVSGAVWMNRSCINHGLMQNVQDF